MEVTPEILKALGVDAEVIQASIIEESVEHLQFHIETAMKTALENANKSIVGGLAQAVRVALAEIGDKLKVEVKTK